LKWHPSFSELYLQGGYCTENAGFDSLKNNVMHCHIWRIAGFATMPLNK
jgi:hypothetical protein